MRASLPFRTPSIVKISATSSSQLTGLAPRYWAGLSSTPSTTTHTEALEAANGAATAAQPSSLVAGVGDQCTGCGARLAPEQRYCVECGERRGQSRLPFAESVAQRTQEVPAPPTNRRPRLTANAAAIAGVGTLVLAMGVGVLIGRSGDHGSGSKNNPVQVIHVAGGSGAAGTAGATNASTAGTNSAATKSKKSGGGKAAKHGGSGAGNGKQPPTAKNLPPPVVKVGTPGHGRGYKNGKFTGDFFGQ